MALKIRPVDLDESELPEERPLDYVQRLAAAKALAGWDRREPSDPQWVLGSDTVVVLDDALLHKPASREEAAATLGLLSGRAHHVITSWAIVGPEGVVARAGYSRTEVVFKALSAAQIEAYVDTGEPMDKAGAYGIQGRAGAFVQRVDGSYAGVVGLPLDEVMADLYDLGVISGPGGELARRLSVIRGRVAAAAEGVGRDPEEITVVAVSKRQPLEKLRALAALGVVAFGENYVQPLRERVELLGEGLEWHFIGRLQRNKAKHLSRVACVHAVEDVRVVEALGRAAKAAGRRLPVMAQVNLSGEESKGGLAPEAVEGFLEVVAAIEGAEVVGLMTMPAPGDLAGARADFRALARLRDDLRTRWPAVTSLSMGMSGDFEVAIAEGATHVRIGTLLFGPRVD